MSPTGPIYGKPPSKQVLRHSPDRLTVTTVATERFQPENVEELTFPLPEPPP